MEIQGLKSEHEKAINRLCSADKWCNDNNYTWEWVKSNKPKTWNERENIIKELEWLEDEMIKEGIIKGKVEGFELVKAT